MYTLVPVFDCQPACCNSVECRGLRFCSYNIHCVCSNNACILAITVMRLHVRLCECVCACNSVGTLDKLNDGF